MHMGELLNAQIIFSSLKQRENPISSRDSVSQPWAETATCHCPTAQLPAEPWEELLDGEVHGQAASPAQRSSRSCSVEPSHPFLSLLALHLP